ncbi:hypothetical protein EGW08_004561 [Elysia chlorotica]|uniref:Stanniocalcin n=1 Tax=Elysia chlorotica TaxID=188477 RepID=A0A3S1BNG3_ELYCH|nr:hypothetical protein EGW08_004561 [Elysia chlorotica]
MKVFVSLVLTLLVAFSHGQDKNGCELSQEALMKMGMECVEHDLSLMLQIMEHMEHPDEMANMKFVCSNQKALVDVAMCMGKKMIGCLPVEARALVQSFVVRARLEAALSLACQHQAELLDQCFDEEAQTGFSGCLVNNVQTMVASLGLGGSQSNGFSVDSFLCRYTEIFKSCLSGNKGRCPQSMLKLYDEIFEMFLPEHHCDKLSLAQTKNGPAGKLLGSLLLHGQPMLTSQTGNVGPVYNYKMGPN